MLQSRPSGTWEQIYRHILWTSNYVYHLGLGGWGVAKFTHSLFTHLRQNHTVILLGFEPLAQPNALATCNRVCYAPDQTVQ